eukprot:9501325-Pyramimonas_sp.AAC.1
MLLESYVQPRVIHAYGCWSLLTVALQGMLAGCAHATTLLNILALRVISKVHPKHCTIMSRALVDDSALQWTGSNLLGGSEISEAISEFKGNVRELGLIVQPEKSGWVSRSRGSWKSFDERAKRLRLTAKKWARNLGHELSGTNPIRKLAEVSFKKFRYDTKGTHGAQRALEAWSPHFGALVWFLQLHTVLLLLEFPGRSPSGSGAQLV